MKPNNFNAKLKRTLLVACFVGLLISFTLQARNISLRVAFYCLCFIQVKNYVSKFFAEKTTTSTEIKQMPCMPLPKVTICPGMKEEALTGDLDIHSVIYVSDEIADSLPEWWNKSTLDLNEGSMQPNVITNKKKPFSHILHRLQI